VISLSITINLVELSLIEVLRYLHFSICLFSALIVLFTWNKVSEEVFPNRNNLLFIAFALLIWCAMDLYRILGFVQLGHVSIVLKIFSTFNNALFLCALPFFSNNIIHLQPLNTLINKPNQWIIYVLTSNIFVILLYSLIWKENGVYNTIVQNIDVVYSCITFLFLGYVIVSAFKKIEENKKPFYYILSLIIVLLNIIPQFLFLEVFEIKYYQSVSITLLLAQLFLVFLIIVLIKEIELTFFFNKLTQLKIQFSNNEADFKNKLVEYESKVEKLNNSIEKIKNEKEQINIEIEVLNEKNIADNLLNKLSEREKEVLKYIHKSYSEIGLKLFISRETVITHKKNIESKLNIHSKDELIKFAKDCGLHSD